LTSRLQTEIEGIKSQGTYKHERLINSKQSARVSLLGGRPGATVLNFCANNYLGLASDPRVAEAAKVALDERGFGLSSVRFICGTTDKHRELERKIAKFHNMEDAILYGSCFDANGGIFEALLGEEDVVFTDALNHASIIDGIRLCKAKRVRYEHINMKDLRTQLEQHAPKARTKFIATDGVFSMDGDIAPLKEICDLADEFNCIVFIDECHATGFFGKTGRGTDEYCGVTGRVDIINSTLGKAMGGGTGGYTAGPSKVVEILRQRSRPYLFSNSLSPSTVAASIKAFDLVEHDHSLVEKVRENTHRFRDGLTKHRFTIAGARDHPIVPVMLGDARLAGDMAEAMLKRGIYVVGFSFPVVPKGKARIRTQISAAHSTEDIEQCIEAFVAVGKELKVIA
jgi:glycine C-acetyltransferase